jgi:hypothetical protein
MYSKKRHFPTRSQNAEKHNTATSEKHFSAITDSAVQIQTRNHEPKYDDTETLDSSAMQENLRPNKK